MTSTLHPVEQSDLPAWIAGGRWEVIRRHFQTLHVADIAEAIMEAEDEVRKDLFQQVAEDQRPDVLAELHEHEEADGIIAALTDLELSDLVEEMSPDDAADMIAELDDERSRSVLTLMEAEDSEEVRALLTYEPESAGGIMTTEVVALSRRLTVSQALKALKDLDVEEPYYVLYVVDAQQNLVGSIGLWELIRLPGDRILREIMHLDPVRVNAGLDQEEVAQMMQKYDLTSLPVVTPTGRLIGRITIDDVLDVLEDEATEDLMRMAGTDESELTSDSPWAACRVRMPWLLVTLFNGFLTSMLMERFLDRLQAVLVLSLFIPMVMAMGGNTGIQTSIVFVRQLALGHNSGREIRRMLIRELQSGMFMGMVCGLLMTLWVPLVMFLTHAEAPFHPLYAGMVAGCSLFLAMTGAGLFGGLFPLLFVRLRIDPAVASGPLITASIDLLSLTLYFLVSLGLVGLLTGTLT